MYKLLVSMLVMISLSGCSILMPYSEKFACEGDAEYGKCTNVSGAYQEAVTGKPSGPTIKRDDEGDAYLDYSAVDTAQSTSSTTNSNKSAGEVDIPAVNIEDPYLQYKNSVYRELSNLIDKPEPVPMVKQPTQVRTLILSYTTDKDYKPLYMPRYVYYMLDDYIWVMGSDLKQQQRRLSELFGE